MISLISVLLDSLCTIGWSEKDKLLINNNNNTIIIIIIIVIKLSFIAHLNKNKLAQKRITEKCLVITQFQ